MSLCTVVGELLSDIPVLNENYGYISLDKRHLLEQPKCVVWRLLTVLGLYLTGQAKSTNYRLLDDVWTSIMHKGRTSFFSRTLLVPVRDSRGDDVILVCRAPTRKTRAAWTRIEFNKPLLWGHYWKLSLSHCNNRLKSTEGEESSAEENEESYYVRQFQKSDVVLARQGRGFSSKLPHMCVCYTLPVLVNASGVVVAIPHFHYVKDSCRVQVSVSFAPPVSLDVYTFVNQYHR